MKKKTILGVCTILLAVIVSVCIYNQLNTNKLEMYFHHVTGEQHEDWYLETIMLYVGTDEHTVAPDGYIENTIAFSDWLNGIMEDVYYVYTKPINLKVYGELNGTKVTFRYEGTVTTQEGETIDYFKEATFDFGVIPEMKGF